MSNYFAHDTIDSIDNQPSERVKTVGYNYSDIILNRIYTAYCGGTVTEDVTIIYVTIRLST